MNFDCSKCGACCRLVGALPAMQSYDRGDGVCRHLSDSNECRIYETRPDLCRVDRMCPTVMTSQEWYRRNRDMCGRLHLSVYGQVLAR